MRLASFDGGRVGVVREASIADVTALVPRNGWASSPIIAAIEGWEELEARLESGSPSTLDLDQVRLDAPIPRPGKIVAAPANYYDHTREMNVRVTMADLGVFLKASSSVIGPRGTVMLPYTDRRTDQEGELAIVMGRRAHRVPVAEALDHVFGYTCLLDISIRGDEDRSTRKSFDTFTPIGPWIATADEVDDPDALDLRCWVGGELRQAANTRDLIFSVRELIAYASGIMTLDPGDVLATGTPAGVGPLSDGDWIVLDIDKVGRLEVGVSADEAVTWADVRLQAS